MRCPFREDGMTAPVVLGNVGPPPRFVAFGALRAPSLKVGDPWTLLDCESGASADCSAIEVVSISPWPFDAKSGDNAEDPAASAARDTLETTFVVNEIGITVFSASNVVVFVATTEVTKTTLGWLETVEEPETEGFATVVEGDGFGEAESVKLGDTDSRME